MEDDEREDQTASKRGSECIMEGGGGLNENLLSIYRGKMDGGHSTIGGRRRRRRRRRRRKGRRPEEDEEDIEEGEERGDCKAEEGIEEEEEEKIRRGMEAVHPHNIKMPINI